MRNGPEQDALRQDAQRFFEQSKGSPPTIMRDQFTRTIPTSLTFDDSWQRQFERVNISSPEFPQILQRSQGKQPESLVPSSWHEEFTRFQAPPTQQFSYQPQVQQRLSSVAYSTGAPGEQHLWAPKVDPKTEDEAFELAFAEAESAIQPRTTLPEPQEEPKLSEAEEAELLAQTAGELFDKLQYERDTDEKFRNSKFMALMKKLRDKEVVISGNAMVEASPGNKSENMGEDALSMQA